MFSALCWLHGQTLLKCLWWWSHTLLHVIRIIYVVLRTVMSFRTLMTYSGEVILVRIKVEAEKASLRGTTNNNLPNEKQVRLSTSLQSPLSVYMLYIFI